MIVTGLKPKEVTTLNVRVCMHRLRNYDVRLSVPNQHYKVMLEVIEEVIRKDDIEELIWFLREEGKVRITERILSLVVQYHERLFNSKNR
jgi:hypothetical protein